MILHRSKWPEATRAFLKITHETYRQAIGDEFGKTVLGFFGDEPDYGWYIAGSPWTPKLLEEFQKQAANGDLSLTWFDAAVLTQKAHEQARNELVATVIEALKAGERPTDVTAWSPFTPAYIRKLARDNGIEAATRSREGKAARGQSADT